ncbi:hypothetical protein ACFFJT_08600 [Dyella flava]|uniref:Uncharacterized protein n=1 Tax=Dyella flava TaxID=1920170 RepID=A0ABS2K937_9GAMM|nr:hypothetical protein [Dyella flava]MBM7127649.1 hypothetical protein [Dyella flava]GLQ51247.1 hypothetical protein GCM10010872_26960 [Dyella flava]
MQIVTRLIAMTRARQLQRQFQQIERNITALPSRTRSRLAIMTLREIGQASRCEFPHLYGTAPEQRYMPWGQGTELGFNRAQSDNPEVALRGIALWLAVAYHETKESPYPSLQPQHRQLLRVLRELRGAGNNEASDASSQWIRSGAAA